jgi:sulfofructose kinase
VTTVVCVGIAVLDHLFQVDELPAGEGKFYADSYREIGGGVAANAAAAVVKLGGTARYVGRVGGDGAGERITADLAALGVDVSAVQSVEGLASPVSAVLVDRAGERLIVNHTPSDLFTGGSVHPAAQIGDADAVLVDVRWPDGAAATLAAAQAAGVPSVFDFDRPMVDGGERLIGTASHIVFSRHALAATSGTPDAAAGLARVKERSPAWLAVTTGGDGVWWLDDDGVHHQAAFPVDVVDTVGAGDVFHGAFALALGEGRSEPDALEFAAAAAAIKCSRPGGRDGTPNRDEVERLLSEHAGRP